MYTTHDNFNPLTPKKYNILSGNFVFNLCDFDLQDVFQECVPGIKQDLAVKENVINIWKFIFRIHLPQKSYM